MIKLEDVLAEFFNGDKGNFKELWDDLVQKFLEDPEAFYESEFLKDEFKEFPTRELVWRIHNKF